MINTVNYSFVKQDFGHPVRDNELGENLDLIDSAIKAREHTEGTSNFAGSGGVTITHNLDLSDYTPSIVPTADAAGDTVSVRKYDLAGLEEWASIKLECAMQAKAASPFGADGYPKGNNEYGKDTGDADEWRFYGDNDPTYTAAAMTLSVRRGSSLRFSAIRLAIRKCTPASVRPCSRQAEYTMN